EATRHLVAINDTGIQPWKLIFSFSRALQDLTLETWGGKKENFSEAQKIFLFRAQCNSAACRGEFINQVKPE
ncbi:MAG TPA: class I fructose-bisphosphate aldolase, partial [Chitinispirillaceae bacterium]|nr:class I fructose-bisphosphate aldolase [Chitinispirillaceae bacterium]